jgi:hypothetical protein
LPENAVGVAVELISELGQPADPCLRRRETGGKRACGLLGLFQDVTQLNSGRIEFNVAGLEFASGNLARVSESGNKQPGGG